MICEVIKIAGRRGEVLLQKFDSVSEIVDFAKSQYDSDDVAQRGQVRRRCQLSDTVFLGRDLGEGIESAAGYANRNWSDGLETVESLAEKLTETINAKPKKVRRRHRYNDDDGDEVCLDRLRAGQPFWSDMVKEISGGPQRVTIVTALSTSASVKAADIFWRGVTAIVLCDLLEAAGYRVKLVAVQSSGSVAGYGSGGGRGSLAILKLKDFADRVDRSTITNALSGWFYRSIFFCAISHSLRNLPMSGLGAPLEILAAEMQHISDDQNLVLIENIWNEDAAMRFIKRAIEEINNNNLIAVAR